jgi:hypothetical protein
MGARAFVPDFMVMVFTQSIVYIQQNDQVDYMVWFSKSYLNRNFLFLSLMTYTLNNNEIN